MLLFRPAFHFNDVSRCAQRAAKPFCVHNAVSHGILLTYVLLLLPLLFVCSCCWFIHNIFMYTYATAAAATVTDSFVQLSFSRWNENPCKIWQQRMCSTFCFLSLTGKSVSHTKYCTNTPKRNENIFFCLPWGEWIIIYFSTHYYMWSGYCYIFIFLLWYKLIYFRIHDFVIADVTFRAFYFVRSFVYFFSTFSLSLSVLSVACFSKYQNEQLNGQKIERKTSTTKKSFHFAIDRNSSRKKMYWLFAHECVCMCVSVRGTPIFYQQLSFLFEISAS